MGKSIGPMCPIRYTHVGAGHRLPMVGPRAAVGGRPRRSVLRSSSAMSFQLAIPRRVALQQSPPPLHQPAPVCTGAFPLATDCRRMV